MFSAILVTCPGPRSHPPRPVSTVHRPTPKPATAIATSLDAMAVGVGLAFLQVNIIATALAIGCATLIMSTLGMMVGRYIGPLLGKRAEILGGIVLIGIGAQILWSHFAG